MTYLENTLGLFIEAAPWLIVGLAFAGLIKAWLPEGALSRWLGGKGLWPVVKAAVVGAPLPLCSCGVLPAAIGLKREGASNGATASFLVSTPETGPDSIAVSYALLGPFMAVVRPIAAVLSAVAAGLLAALAPEEAKATSEPVASCCAKEKSCSSQNITQKQPLPARTVTGLRFAFGDMLDDIAGWMIVGFLVAGAAVTVVPPGALAEFGSGLPAMLVMLVVGVPLYVCASASTPIAAAMILAGVSPGTALVFLLVGPATNFAGIVLIAKEMGVKATAGYLGGVAGGALIAGLATDWAIQAFSIDVAAQAASVHGMLPIWLEAACGVLLALMMARKYVKQLVGRFSPA